MELLQHDRMHIERDGQRDDLAYDDIGPAMRLAPVKSLPRDAHH